jgi:hypothetical protein
LIRRYLIEANAGRDSPSPGLDTPVIRFECVRVLASGGIRGGILQGLQFSSPEKKEDADNRDVIYRALFDDWQIGESSGSGDN